MRMRGAWVDADLAWLKVLLLCMLLHGSNADTDAVADNEPSGVELS
jgi:hypothetical protein